MWRIGIAIRHLHTEVPYLLKNGCVLMTQPFCVKITEVYADCIAFGAAPSIASEA